MLLRQPDQLLPPPERERRSRRVLEIDDGVDQLAAPPLATELLELLAGGVGDHPLGIDRHVQHLRPVTANGVERAGEGRRLRQHGIAHVQEGAERQRQRVPRAVGDDEVLRRDLEALEERVLVADQLAQAAVALVIPVGQRLGALGLHHPGGSLDDAVVREGRGIREAAAELVERVLDRPRRRRRAPPADAAAGREQIVEAGDGCGGHARQDTGRRRRRQSDARAGCSRRPARGGAGRRNRASAATAAGRPRGCVRQARRGGSRRLPPGAG